MLDFFRNHKRLMQILLGLLIVPSLGLVGAQGLRGFFDSRATVAKVNGRPIARQEYEAAVHDRLARIRQMLGSAFDAKTMDTSVIRQALLDSLIQQHMLNDEIQRKYLTASDAAVRKAILEMPAIAQLRKPDGTIDLDRYQRFLAAQQLTPEQLDSRVRAMLASEQISDSIEASAFMPKALAERLVALSEQQREVQSLVLRAADYRNKVQLNDTDLQQYYDAHPNEFTKPETAKIQYLTLSAAALAKTIEPTEAELKEYYKDHLAAYRTEKQIRARHILFAVPAHASATERAEARTKAQALRVRLRTHPEQFVQLARENSQDPGSANKGGDLGYFGPNMMVKSFETTAFKLKPQEISGVVESDFGYHLIQVTDIKPAVNRPFDEVKPIIAAALQKQQVVRQFAEQAEQFSNLAYEQADSLKAVADKFKLTIQTATVKREPNPALSPTHPLSQTKLLAAIFAEDSLENKHNTPAIEVGDNTLVAARVIKYQPAAVQPINLVKQQLQTKVSAIQAAAQTRQMGVDKLAALQKTQATEGFSAPITVSHANAKGLPPAAMTAIFKADFNAPTQGKAAPKYVGVDLGLGGYAIYRINAVHTPTIDSHLLVSAQQQLAQMNGQSEMNAYLASLRARSKVKVYKVPAAEEDE